mgnify:FL=1
MATARPFAYNPPPNSSIAGTDQVGSLAVGTPTSGFTTSPRFWNGPDEDLGYVVAHPTSGGTQPNPLSISAYLGFWRTPDFTDGSFIDLAQYVSIQNGTPQTFSSATQASTWLTTNGYWNSYGGSFTIYSTDFTSFYWGSNMSVNGTTGFTTNSASVGPGYSFYGPELGSSQGGNPTKLAEILAYWNNNGLTVGNNAYMFNVTWGAGSTFGSGVAVLSFYYNSGGVYSNLNIGPVDTSNPVWQTSGTNIYNGPPAVTCLVGTFNLPATFSLIRPIITDNDSWC